MSSKILRVLIGVHMGLGHRGLHKLIKKNAKLDLHAIPDGELILCLNRQGDKMKVIGGRGRIIGYLRMPSGQRIMMDALQYLPMTFGGAGFDYDAAVTKALTRRFASYPKARPSPLKAAENAKNAGLN